MTREERLAWAKSATPEEWAEALATLVMGWHKVDCLCYFVDDRGVPMANRLPIDDIYQPEPAWNPPKNIADAWQVHRKLADGPLRSTYLDALWAAAFIRAGGDSPGRMASLALDMTESDICLAALLTVEDQFS